MKLKHDDLLQLILDALQYSGITCWATHRVGAYKHKPLIKGISDILGILTQDIQIKAWEGRVGQWLSIEVKMPGDKLSTDQEEFKYMVESAGGLYIEARSLEDVTEHPALKDWIKVK